MTTIILTPKQSFYWIFLKIFIIIFSIKVAVYGDFKQNLTKEERQWLEQKQTITIGAMDGWPPLNFVDHKLNPSGIGADLVSLLNKKLDGKIKIVSSSWGEIYTKAQNCQLDAILDITPKKEREEFFEFTAPYLQIPHVIVSHKNSQIYESLAQLKGKTVALEEKIGTIADLQKEYPKIKIKTYPSTSLCLHSVSSGAVDAYIGNRAAVSYLMAQELLDLKIDAIDTSRKSSPLTIGACKKNAIVISILQKTLDEIKTEELNIIFSKWAQEKKIDIGLTREEKNYLREKKRLKFVTAKEEWEPFVFTDKNGVSSGLEMDFVQLLSLHLNIPIQIERLPWNEALKKMENSREYDAIFPASKTKDREKYLNFSKPYYLSPVVLLGTRETAQVFDLKELKGKKIALIEGSALEELINKKDLDIQIVKINNSTENLIRAILDKKADMALDFQAPLRSIIDKLNLRGEFKPLMTFHSESLAESAYGVRQNDPILVEIINKAIDSFLAAEKRALKSKWEGKIHTDKEEENENQTEGEDSENKIKKITLSPQEEEYIRLNPTITVANEPDWPPFDFIQNNIPAGLGIDYARLVAKKLGLKLSFAQSSWQEILNDFKENKIDLLHSIYKTKEREEFINFSSSYFNTMQVIVINKDSKIKNTQDLEGKKIAIVQGYGTSDILKKNLKNFTILQVLNISEALRAVSFGQADAAIENLGSISYAIMEQTLTNLKIIDTNLPIEKEDGNLYFGTQKGNPILGQMVQKAIDSITPQEHLAIKNRWILSQPEDIKPQKYALELTKLEKEWIKNHPILKYTGDPNYLPYEQFEENGKYSGMVADYLEILEKRVGIKFEKIAPKDWTDAVEKAKNGEVDIISAYKDDPYLSNTHIFTKNYINSPIVVVKRKEKKGQFISDLNNLEAQEIGVVKGYGYLKKIFEKYPNLKYKEVQNAKEVLEGVASGKFEAGLCSLQLATYNINTLGLNNLQIVGKSEFDMELSFALKKDFQILGSILNKALDSITQEEKKNLHDKWVNIEFLRQIDYELIQKILIFLVLASFGMFYWNFSLKRKVSQKTAQLQELLNSYEENLKTLAQIKENLEKMVQERTNDLSVVLKEQKAIFDSASIGIFLLQNRVVVQTNKKTLEIFGYTLEEFLGKSTQDFYADKEEFKTIGDFYADVWEGKTVIFESLLVKKDSENFWGRVSMCAIEPNNRSRGVVATLQDITLERKAIEEIKNAKILAEDATRIKSSFLANMSHEIRTPMNAIIGLTNLALEVNPDSKQGVYLKKIDKAAKILLGIINDILDFSKIESGKIELEEIDFFLEDVLENIADLSVLKAQEKGLELLFDVEPNLPTGYIGDPLRLGQIITNLVSNGIKFTQNGEVTVKISLMEEPQDGNINLKFEIKDTGIGLTQEQIVKLFKAFSQADTSTTRQYGGTGLGLIISKKLAQKMGGDLWVESEIGVGSIFSFNAKFRLQQTQKQIKKGESFEHLRILVVDDNGSAREILEKMVVSLQFETTAVKNANEAIDELKNGERGGRPYGLAIIDWMMPGIDGIDTIELIEKDKEITRKPILIMITAYNKDDLLSKTKNVKIDGFLTKPISPSTLYDTILTSFGHRPTLKNHKFAIDKATKEALNGAYILLAEDNVLNQEFAIELLEQAKIRVDLAQNGKEAVEMFGKNDYDGILMDCQMPILDGYGATKIIREMETNGKRVPILAMTANVMPQDKELCQVSGMDDHIAKPIDTRTFFTTMAKWIVPIKGKSNTTMEDIGQNVEDFKTLSLEIDGLDLEKAFEMVSMDEKLLKKLLIRFAQVHKNWGDETIGFIDDGRFEDAYRQAHTLKGLGGGIGSKKITDIAREIELKIKNKEWAEAKSAIRDGQTQIDEISKKIMEKISIEDEKIKGQDRDFSLIEHLDKLKKLLEGFDSDALEEGEMFVRILEEKGFDDIAQNLKMNLDEYEFEKAAQVLENFKTRIA